MMKRLEKALASLSPLARHFRSPLEANGIRLAKKAASTSRDETQGKQRKTKPIGLGVFPSNMKDSLKSQMGSGIHLSPLGAGIA